MAATGPLADCLVSKRNPERRIILGDELKSRNGLAGWRLRGYPADSSPQRLTRGAFDHRVPSRQLLRLVHPLLLNFRNSQPQAIDLRA